MPPPWDCWAGGGAAPGAWAGEEGAELCGRGRRRLMLDGFVDERERDVIGLDGRRCGFAGC